MTNVALLALLCVPLAFGQGKGKGKGQDRAEPAGSISAGISIGFGNDRALIQQYAQSLGGSNLPPGLAKRGGNLPPGLEKQLQRNGRLPPGLEKQMSPFPVDLERRLSPLPSGYTRIFIAGRAAIYNRSTQIIADIFVPLP